MQKEKKKEKKKEKMRRKRRQACLFFATIRSRRVDTALFFFRFLFSILRHFHSQYIFSLLLSFDVLPFSSAERSWRKDAKVLALA
jgi:hypothetical protein